MKPVPAELSISTYVDQRWLSIEKDAYQGLPFTHAIDRVDSFVQNAINDFNNNNLLEGYDWPSDISRAIATNRFKKDWLQRTLLVRKEYVDWWREFITTTQRDLTLGAVEARKLLIISHGAAMLGAMAALGAIENNEMQSSFLVVAFGALVGLLLAGVGVVIWLESFGNAISKLHSDFRSTHKMKRYGAYSRYLNRRIAREAKWSIWLTYASFIALPIYAVWALLLATFR